MDQVQFLDSLFRLKNLLNVLLRIITSVLLDKLVDTAATIGVEIFFKPFHVTTCPGEIQVKHLITVLQAGRMLTDPEVAKQVVELFCHRFVIVSLHHADEQTLSETTGTDEE